MNKWHLIQNQPLLRKIYKKSLPLVLIFLCKGGKSFKGTLVRSKRNSKGKETLKETTFVNSGSRVGLSHLFVF